MTDKARPNTARTMKGNANARRGDTNQDARLAFRCSSALSDRIREEAQRSGRTISQMVVAMLEASPVGR